MFFLFYSIVCKGIVLIGFGNKAAFIISQVDEENNRKKSKPPIGFLLEGINFYDDYQVVWVFYMQTRDNL